MLWDIKSFKVQKTEEQSSVFLFANTQKQHGSVKPQQPKSYSYTEPKSKANQYVNNGVNTNNTAKTYSYNSPKTYTYNQPKTYTYTSPKTNIGEYKTLGGYTNTNPYVTKDRVGNGQNSYSAQPKPQVKNDYTGAKKPTVVDELWNRYYTEVAGTNGIKQPQKLTKTTEPKQQNTNTVKAGKSTINIRDDGSTIHYDSDTAIDLFDFLDFLSGRYGPSNEMAESVKIAKPTEPDLVAGAAQYPSVQGKPVMKYENMVSPPSAEYQKKAAELYKEASFNRDFYLKAKEIDVMNDNPDKYYLRLDKLWNIKRIAEESKLKVYSYNENESDENNKQKLYGMVDANLDGSKPNSLQHMLWSALLSEELGPEEAYNITTAHETYTNEQYLNGALYNQDDIGRVSWGQNNYNMAYPLRVQHVAMDLHNNNLGIIIEQETPVERTKIEKELKELLGEGESISELKRYYPDLTLRQILIMKKIIAAIENGEAAIIWDKYY